jgi:zinc transporter 2
MTDAAHLLSDVAGFAVSLFAIYLGTLPANAKMPFGYQRAEVIGAIISVFLIWLLTIWLLYTAISRIIQQAEQNAKDAVKGKAMFFISSFGLCVNLLLMRILGHGHSHGLSHSHGHSHGLSHCDSHGHSHGLSHSDSHGHSRGHSHEHGHRHSHDHENYLHHRHHHHDDDDDEKDISKPVAEHPVEDPPFGQDAVECGSTDLDHPELKLKTSNVDLTQESSSISSSWDQAFANFENINVRAAYIHALSDFIQSLGVCVAGALIWYNPDWQIADPLTTIFFSILVLVATFGIMKNSIMILMEATPIGIHTPSIELKLLQLESVFDVKQLHIWSLTEGRMAANLHIEYNGSAAKQALVDSKRVLKEQGIEWITIQVEEPSSSRSYETQTL